MPLTPSPHLHTNTQPNIDRGFARAGFAIPARRAWPEALGPSQLASYSSCLEVRYPRTPGSRSRRAVWRGSNTDRDIDPMEEGNALDAARSRLHLFGRWCAACGRGSGDVRLQRVGVIAWLKGCCLSVAFPRRIYLTTHLLRYLNCTHNHANARTQVPPPV